MYEYEPEKNSWLFQICMTLLLMSSMRMIFYIPLASFRVAALILPELFSLPEETSLELLALGVIFYVYVLLIQVL